MSFSEQEKAHVKRYVDANTHLMHATRILGDVAATKGHLLRSQIGELLSHVGNAFFALWRGSFHALAGTPPVKERALMLDEAKKGIQAVLHYITVDPKSSKWMLPEFVSAKTHMDSARDLLAGFDWSLPYENPKPDDSPTTSFDESLTVVGPHGDLSKAIEALRFVAWYHGHVWLQFSELYRKHALVYVEEANIPLRDQIYSLAHIADKIGRTYVMHVGVEADVDTAVIDADHAAASGARPRDFHRAMRQIELMFTSRFSEGKNWHGRDFETGGVQSLELKTIERFFLPLAKANGSQWTYDMVISDTGQFGGRLISVTGQLTDYWQVFDAWGHIMMNFYHAMPAPTVFVPRTGGDDGGLTIPEGFFDGQVSVIQSQQDRLLEVDRALDTMRAELTALEGRAI